MIRLVEERQHHPPALPEQSLENRDACWILLNGLRAPICMVWLAGWWRLKLISIGLWHLQDAFAASSTSELVVVVEKDSLSALSLCEMGW